MAGDFDSAIEDAVGSALSEGGDSQDTSSTSDVGTDSGATTAPAAPAAATPAPSAPTAPAQPSWSPPSREHYELLEREAAIARAWSPDKIREAFASIGQPQAAAPAAPQPPDPNDEFYKTYFGSGQPGSVKFWNDLRADPTTLERGVNAIVARNRKADFETIKSLKADYEKVQAELQELRGFSRIAEHRFAESPDWQAHGPTVTQLFRDGIVNGAHPDAIKHAFDIAKAQAKAAGATTAQANAAGNQAAAAVASGAAAAPGAPPAPKPPAPPAQPAKPEPRDEASLRGGAKRSASGAGSAAEDQPRGADGQWLEKIARGAVAKGLAGARK